jgi:hypothetical protein
MISRVPLYSTQFPLLRGNVDESTVVVANALSKVDVGLNGVTVNGVEVSTEHRNVVIALHVERDIASRAREALATPVESTVVVANVVVEVKTRLLRLAISVVALSNEDVTVLELDIGRALVKVDGGSLETGQFHVRKRYGTLKSNKMGQTAAQE